MKHLDKIYLFNPYYSLRNDKKRVLLTNSPSFKIPASLAEDEITSFIHPVFGIVFSFFNGIDSLKKVIENISKKMKFPEEEIYNFILPFLENNKRVGIEYDNNFFEFPKRILVDNSKSLYSSRTMNYEEFEIKDEYDFSTYRLYEGPSTITLLINTVCVTDCIYCYVDRRNKKNCEIPISRLKELIHEAKKMKVVNFDIAGTEFFLYKHWDELIKELIENGFYPYLSTKIPIGAQKIKKLKEIGVKDLQLSIDSVNPAEVVKVNKIYTKNYVNKMFKTLKHLEDNNINCAINTVLTNENNSKEGILNLLNRLTSFSNVNIVTINPAERSAYWDSGDFDNKKSSLKQLESIESFLSEIEGNYSFEIVFASYSKKEEFINDFEILSKEHNERALCSANKEQMCILSDGQVTICEELYWNPRFIIGNVLNQSIKEVWQSEEALKLENLSRSDFSNNSFCKTCPSFENCRLNIGVCWSNVASAYGESNWDFPSPSCPYSPPLTYSMYHE